MDKSSQYKGIGHWKIRELKWKVFELAFLFLTAMN